MTLRGGGEIPYVLENSRHQRPDEVHDGDVNITKCTS
jgi:hypothetical protein